MSTIIFHFWYFTEKQGKIFFKTTNKIAVKQQNPKQNIPPDENNSNSFAQERL